MADTLHSAQINAADPLVIVGQDEPVADTLNVKNAIDAINLAGGGTIEFCGRIQINAEQFITTGNVWFKGARDSVIISAFDSSLGTGPRNGDFESLFTFRPSSGFDFISLDTTTTEIKKSDISIALTDGLIGSSGIKEGDWLELKSDKIDTRTNGSTSFYGQAVKIANLDASGDPDLVHISTALNETVSRNTNTQIGKITLLPHIYIDDIVFENPNDNLVSLIELYGVRDSYINGMRAARESVTGIGASGALLLRNTFDVEINDYVHEGVTDRLMSGAYAHQEYYGILMTDYGNVFVNNPLIIDTRHALTTSGVLGNCVLSVKGGYLANKGSAVMDMHDQGFVSLKNVRIDCSQRPAGDGGYDLNSKCIQIRASGFLADGCDLWGTGELIAFLADLGTISNCNIHGHGNRSAMDCQNRTGTKFIDNTIHESGWYGISCAGSTDTVIDGNKFYDTCNLGQNEHIFAKDAEGLIVTNNYLVKNPNITTSVRHDRIVPTVKGQFYGNDCRGFGDNDDGFILTFTAAAVADNADNDFTDENHGLVDDDRVTILASTFPNGITADTLYYIVNSVDDGVGGSDDTFQLSLAEGGSVEPFTTNGSSVTWRREYLSSPDAISRRSDYVSDSTKTNLTDGPTEEVTVEVISYFVTLDGAGNTKAFFRVPSRLDGSKLVGVSATLGNALSSSGLPSIQITRSRFETPGGSRSLTELLSTKITIDVNEWSSVSAVTPAVIDTSEDVLLTDDILYANLDLTGTGAAGMYVTFEFE